MPGIIVPPQSARDAADHFSKIHDITPEFRLETIVRDGVQIDVWGKFENLNAVYTFKARGAEWFFYNILYQYHNHVGKYGGKRSSSSLPIFITASAGNHAQGVALAAKRYGVEAQILMPQTTPIVKRKRVEELGAKIILHGQIFDETLAEALRYKLEDSANRIFVPPYEHPDIMAGQGSIGVEILRQGCRCHANYLSVAHRAAGFTTDDLWDLPDVILCGIGGGGLVSGVGSVVQEFNKATGLDIKVIGVQTEAADSMYQSWKSGELRKSTDPTAKSYADGINVKQASQRMLDTVTRYADAVVVVTEDHIKHSIVSLAQNPNIAGKYWHTHERNDASVPFRRLPQGANQVHEKRKMNKFEGAAAAPYAAAVFGDLHGELDLVSMARESGKDHLKVMCILTGSNIDKTRRAELAALYERPKWLNNHG